MAARSRARTGAVSAAVLLRDKARQRRTDLLFRDVPALPARELPAVGTGAGAAMAATACGTLAVARRAAAARCRPDANFPIFSGSAAGRCASA